MLISLTHNIMDMSSLGLAGSLPSVRDPGFLYLGAPPCWGLALVHMVQQGSPLYIYILLVLPLYSTLAMAVTMHSLFTPTNFMHSHSIF